MATTLTLADVQRVKAEKGDDFGAAIVDLVQRDCDMAAILDFVTLGTVEMKRRVSNSVGTVGFRTGRGQPFGNISGPAYDEVADQVFSLGAEIKMDKTDVYDKMAGDILGQRTRFAVRALSQTFNEYFVNGDHATDPHGFEGVKVRLANSPAGQVIYGVSSSAELDVRAAASRLSLLCTHSLIRSMKLLTLSMGTMVTLPLLRLTLLPHLEACLEG